MAGWKWEVEDGKELLWRVIRKVCVKEKLLVCKKGGFSAHAKPTNKEKPFFSTAKFQLSTAPKLTCNNPFRISSATVSLQQNIPFSKLRNLASTVRLPFRTDSNPHRRYPGRLKFPGIAGYLMNAGHFNNSHVSSGDLNRPRSPEVRKPRSP